MHYYYLKQYLKNRQKKINFEETATVRKCYGNRDCSNSSNSDKENYRF